MKHEKLSDALEHISDRHIAEATAHRRRFPWLGAVAAMLVLCILAGIVLRPNTQGTDCPDVPLDTSSLYVPNTAPPLQLQQIEPISYQYAVATPEYPRLSPYPQSEAGQEAHDQWWQEQRELHDQPEVYADNLDPCWAQLLPALLQQEQAGANAACSPVNVYMALAMLAECAQGESRQQLLNLLNAQSIDALREQAGHVWRGHYNDDGLSKTILGSSLWLEEGLSFDQDTVKVLADHYYASVFQGNLGTPEMDTALRSWLNEQTDGLLQDRVEGVTMDPRTLLALATTVSYQVQWSNEFQYENNTQEVFHGAAGDTTEVFMHQELTYGPYFWSDRFSAVYLYLRDGSRMWLILPDEGVSPEEITDEVAQFLAQHPDNIDSSYENQKNIRVKLSLPRFDVGGEKQLIPALQKLGVTDVFDLGKADLTAVLPEVKDSCISQVTHAARVTVDEKGVTAAAFTVIIDAGAGMPPLDEIDFTLDRPFLFCVESRDGLPLFAGIVNEP